MKKFLLAFGVILALAFSVTAATSDFNPTHETTVSADKDGDCDKCGKKDCKGCDASKKACKKGDKKSCCKKGDATAAKSCCKKGASKKACAGKKECKKGAHAEH